MCYEQSGGILKLQTKETHLMESNQNISPQKSFLGGGGEIYPLLNSVC